MNTFNFCWTVLAVESEKHNIFLDQDNCSVQNNYEEEFNKPIKRISYIYKYGCFNIHFFNHCLSSFIAEVPDSLKIIDKICLTKNINICSLSTGPGTYVIGFLYALHLLGKSLTGSVNYKFITKHISWSNMVCEMLGLVPLNAPKPSSCKFIHCDVWIGITPKALSSFKNADILFICHTFSSSRDDSNVICRISNDILQLLKPGALVFFIFHEDNSKNLKELTTFGHFLYGPTEITLKDMPYDKTIPTLVKVPVVDSGSSFFGVWQKSNSNLNQETSSTVKLLAVTPVSEPLNDINIIKTDTAQSISKSKIPFQLANTPTSDSKLTISSENVSISTESSASLNSAPEEHKLICSNKANCVKKVSGGQPTKSISEDFFKIANTPISNPKSTGSISSKNGSISKESNASSKSGSAEPKLICGKPVNFVKKMQEIANDRPPTSTGTIIAGQKNEPSKNNPSNPESSLNSLVKTLERLVTNLEEFNSQNRVRNHNNQQCCFTCPCHIQNMHTENWNTRHNFNSCVWNRCHHSPCAQNHHICSNCSMSNKHNCCQNVRGQNPCIVIPLQNTTETALAQVFSVVSQVNNSSS